MRKGVMFFLILISFAIILVAVQAGFFKNFLDNITGGLVKDSSFEPSANEEEVCMQKCIKVGCEIFDFNCQEENRASCEEECGMPENTLNENEMNEEQKCIAQCIKESPNPDVKCSNTSKIIIGKRVCKICAKGCEYLNYKS
jgi:hypothetical protein